MKTLLIENQKLGKIINQIIEGGFGIDSNDFLITNNSNEKFKQFAIKSCSINITDKVVEAIGDLNLEIDGFENEVLDFIVFTVHNDEENQKICYCATLSELIILYDDILVSDGWNCYTLENY